MIWLNLTYGSVRGMIIPSSYRCDIDAIEVGYQADVSQTKCIVIRHAQTWRIICTYT